MEKEINRIICVGISGKFAHFRKFYTNASSLSYLIPPRTVVIGMLASILKIPRDEYYEIFSEDKIKISVVLPRGTEIKRQTQSLNYLHKDYFSFITQGKGKMQHFQCKLELLMSSKIGRIRYEIFVGSNKEDKYINKLESNLRKNELGYGIYLGQRQFRADLDYVKRYNDSDIVFLANVGFVDSAFPKSAIIDLNHTSVSNIVSEQMPFHFRKVISPKDSGREPISVERIFFERNGNRIRGSFRNCYQIKDKVICLY